MSTRRKVLRPVVEAMADRLPEELLDALRTLHIQKYEFAEALDPREDDLQTHLEDCAMSLRVKPAFLKKAWALHAKLKAKADAAAPLKWFWGALGAVPKETLLRWEEFCIATHRGEGTTRFAMARFTCDNLAAEPVWNPATGTTLPVTVAQLLELDKILTMPGWSSESAAHKWFEHIVNASLTVKELQELAARPFPQIEQFAIGLSRRMQDHGFKRRNALRTIPSVPASLPVTGGDPGRSDVLERYTPEALIAIGAAAGRSSRALFEGLTLVVTEDGFGGEVAAQKAFDVEDLNWSAYQRAERSPAVRFQLLNHIERWIALFPTLPYSAVRCPLVGFRTGVCLSLLKEFKVPLEKKVRGTPKAPEQSLEKVGAGVVKWSHVEASRAEAIVRLVTLFGDEASIKRFMRLKGLPWTAKGVHDAGQFTLPDDINGWTPSKWRALCLRHPQAVKWGGYFAQLEIAHIYPTSLAQLRKEVNRLNYPDAPPGLEEFIEVCQNAGLSPSVTKDHLKYLATYTPKTAELMPHVVVYGSELGLSGNLTLLKLKADEPLVTLLGVLTNCCQHLTGSGAGCVHAGLESPYSGFYGIYDHGVLVAQCWAWRANNGGVVFDSWESAENLESLSGPRLNAFASLIAKAAQKIVEGPLGVPCVLIGRTDSGFTTELGRVLKSRGNGRSSGYSLKPVEMRGYFDGEKQLLIAGQVPGAEDSELIKPSLVDGYLQPEAPVTSLAELLPVVREWPRL